MTRLPMRALLRCLLWAALIPVLALGAAAQSVDAKLYAKAQGPDLVVAVELTPGFGSWIYDDEDPGDFAVATSLEFGGVDGAEWSKARFPDPTVKPGQLAVNRVFKKRIVAYAIAPGAAAGANPGAVTATLTGQVCDERLCVNVSKDLTASGAGADALWAGFPADLAGGAAADSAAADTARDAGEGTTGTDDADLAWTPAFAEGEVAKARYFARSDGELVEVVVQVAVPEHFHMYGGPTTEEMGTGIGSPTTLEVESDDAEFSPAQYPEPKPLVVPPFVEGGEATYLWSYEGSFLFGLEGEALEEDLDPAGLAIRVEGQSCDDAGCTPVSLVPEFAGEGTEALYAAAFATWERPAPPDLTQFEAADGHGDGDADPMNARSAPAGSDGDADGAGGAPAEFGQKRSTEGGLLSFIWLAVVAGLATLLMPCTYPMIPITLSYFTKQADARGGKVAPLAIVYGLGIIATFVVAGVGLSTVIVDFANHWVTNLFIGALFIVFALSLFGMFELRPPQFLMRAAGGANQKGGYGGVFMMGLTLVVTSFTCTGPFVGSLLAGGAGAGYSTFEIGLGMAAFGATMAAPFVVLALLPGKASAMPSAGAWMNTLKVFMGFVELAAALKFISNADIAQQWMLLPREVFLALWTVISVVAGLFLLGRVNLKGESPDGMIGPG
ncbi:MAG: cytochrome c biogenesis protein CcdA, partial [Planctomycetota bacterium]